MNYNVIIIQSGNLATVQTNINNFYQTNPGITVVSAEMFVVRNSNTARIYTYTITYKK